MKHRAALRRFTMQNSCCKHYVPNESLSALQHHLDLFSQHQIFLLNSDPKLEILSEPHNRMAGLVYRSIQYNIL